MVLERMTARAVKIVGIYGYFRTRIFINSRYHLKPAKSLHRAAKTDRNKIKKQELNNISFTKNKQVKKRKKRNRRLVNVSLLNSLNINVFSNKENVLGTEIDSTSLDDKGHKVVNSNSKLYYAPRPQRE